jgi:hypothetical protein
VATGVAEACFEAADAGPRRPTDVKAMSGVILAVPDRPDCAARVLAAAARLAELTRSTRINVLAIRTPPIATILPTEEILTRRDELRIRNDEQARTHALKAIYDAWSAGDAVAIDTVTEWVDVEGMADELVDEWGRRADFIVLKRPSVHWLEGSVTPRAVCAGVRAS